MAYVTKYQSNWNSHDGAWGLLTIQEKDYVGSVIPITLQHNAINVTPVFKGWESPVVGRRCRLNILNDKEDYFELFELMTATERQFKVIVLSSSPLTTLFVGFIDVKANSAKYLQFGVIKLVASSYLSKLKYIYPTSIDTKQNLTFINLIDEILTGLGVSNNIRINCKLYAAGDTLLAGQTLFNKNGIDTEVFWKNNIDRDTSLEILNKILTPFNCFIYWYENYWYVDHYTDMWNTSIDYVEYTTGVPYSPTDAGSVVNVSKVVQDIHDLVFINTSQNVKTTPGYRLIQLRFDSSDSLLLNLLASFTRDIPSATIVTTPFSEMENPDVREWLFLSQDNKLLSWSNAGIPFYTIANSVRRNFNESSLNSGVNLASSFLCTVQEDTSITIEYKYGEITGEVQDVIANDPSSLSELYFKFWVVITWREGANEKNITYQPNTDGFPPYYVRDTLLFPLQDTMPVVIVEGTQFDKDNITAKISINIPLSEVASAYGLSDSYLIDNDIKKYNITIHGEKLYKRFKNHDGERNVATVAVLGDFKIAVSNDVDFNLLEGSINTDFLDKKEIPISIADNANLNYTNGILRGDDLDIRTDLWQRSSSTWSLVEWLMAEKFRIYSETRQQISSQTKQSSIIRPFSLFTESKQAGKKFVLPNAGYFPSVSEGKVELEEYDNETEINIIEG